MFLNLRIPVVLIVRPTFLLFFSRPHICFLRTVLDLENRNVGHGFPDTSAYASSSRRTRLKFRFFFFFFLMSVTFYSALIRDYVMNVRRNKPTILLYADGPRDPKPFVRSISKISYINSIFTRAVFFVNKPFHQTTTRRSTPYRCFATRRRCFDQTFFCVPSKRLKYAFGDARTAARDNDAKGFRAHAKPRRVPVARGARDPVLDASSFHTRRIISPFSFLDAVEVFL